MSEAVLGLKPQYMPLLDLILFFSCLLGVERKATGRYVYKLRHEKTPSLRVTDGFLAICYLAAEMLAQTIFLFIIHRFT